MPLHRLTTLTLGVPDLDATRRFYTELGLDETAPGRFATAAGGEQLRLEPAPVAFLHHAAWEVADVDEVGRGAQRMLEADPRRHVWGLGRHHIGSNHFWYLRDPAGNFAEYTADVDVITDDDVWQPGRFALGKEALYAWGPAPSPSFLAPEDLAALVKGAAA
jgi:catechol 2,3-dioxygenase-like lactoylglutathione lyase family enzyme